MANQTQFSVASFNLYNLNLPGLRIYRDTDGWDPEVYESKVTWTALMLKSLKSDVWGFQELWHHQALTDVFTRAGQHLEYELLVPEGHAGGRIVCAGAVKKEILVGEPTWIENFPEKFRLESGGDAQSPDISISVDRFSRPVLRFTVQPRSNDTPIAVYVAHLKSKTPAEIYREGWYRDDDEYYSKHRTALGSAVSTIRRTAEAAALRMILTEEMKGTETPVIVLGDLNDGQHSNTINILTGQPNYLFSGSLGGSDTALYTVGTLQAYRSQRDIYYTHIYQNTHESLDHILVSQEFYDNSRKRVWLFEGMELRNDHLDRDDHKLSGTGDHGVVRASFKYDPI